MRLLSKEQRGYGLTTSAPVSDVSSPACTNGVWPPLRSVCMDIGKEPGEAKHLLGFENSSKKRLFSQFPVGKNKFHHFWPLLERFRKNNLVLPSWKKSFRRPCLSVWRRRTNRRPCCPPMSNSSNYSWTVRPDSSAA